MIAGLITVAIMGYLLGSIPFGLIVGKLTRGVDVRKRGSGKTGMTNILRTTGVVPAVTVTLGDLAKGAGAVLLANAVIGTGVMTIGSVELDLGGAQVIAALVAVAGHNWSAYIRFQGGRGVTTFFGGLLVMCWPVALIAGGGVLLSVAILTRYFSLGSISGMVAAALLMLAAVILWQQPPEYLVYTLAGTVLILLQHRGNIKRLLSGTERKLGKEAEFRE